MHRKSVLLIFSLLFLMNIHCTSFVIFDMDIRYYSKDEMRLTLDSMGMSYRRIFSDKKGDRFIFFTSTHFMHDMEDFMMEELYLSYKGPMGRWSIGFGKHIIPVGLSYNFESKILPIKTMKHFNFDKNNPWGMLFSGIVQNFNYAFSLSFSSFEKPGLINFYHSLSAFRIGIYVSEVSDSNIGISFAAGDHKTHHGLMHKEIIAVDLTAYLEKFILRGEITYGIKHNYGGIFLSLDYILIRFLEISSALSYFNDKNDPYNPCYLGIKYNVMGFNLKIYYIFYFTGGKNEIMFQIYRAFNIVI